MYGWFLGRDWCDIGRETAPDLPLGRGRPQVSVVCFLFSLFVTVSPCFLLILSHILIGIEWAMRSMGWVGCKGFGCLSNKSEESIHFRQFRWCSIVRQVSIGIDCFFFPFVWLVRFLIECWRDSMCLGGVALRMGWRDEVGGVFGRFCRFFFLSFRFHLTLVFADQRHQSM